MRAMRVHKENVWAKFVFAARTQFSVTDSHLVMKIISCKFV